MTDRDALLAAYDALRPWLPADPQPGLTYEQRGSVLRVVGQHRGFIDTARDVFMSPVISRVSQRWSPRSGMTTSAG